MLADILVTSNFPDVLSCGVEYTVSFQLLMDERRDCVLRYVFSDDDIVKRLSKKEESGTFFYDNVSITFVLKGTGVHTFSILLGNNTIYEKSFIVEEIIDPIYYENEIEEPLCLRKPDNIIMERSENVGLACVIKGVLTAIITALVGVLIFACVVKITLMQSNSVKIINQIIKQLAFLVITPNIPFREMF